MIPCFFHSSSYVGDIHSGQFEGRGEYRWPNGDVYVGQYSGGLRNGDGDMSYADGDSYRGGWRDGKYHGQGDYRSGSNQERGLLYM